MAETLEAGLRQLFGGGAPPTAGAPRAEPAITATETNAQLLRDANDAYDKARAALRGEDWTTYGAEMKRLGDLLRRLGAGRP